MFAPLANASFRLTSDSIETQRISVVTRSARFFTLFLSNYLILKQQSEKEALEAAQLEIQTEEIQAATICLFKSNQEKYFFDALKELLDSYEEDFFVYPNVAVSCLLDFEAIKESLTKEEQDYFFKAIVDCVVFDEGYMPIYFFEIDSIWHDIKKVQEKDDLKNSIFEKAGVDLHRIRGKNNAPISKEDFQKEIKKRINL